MKTSFLVVSLLFSSFCLSHLTAEEKPPQTSKVTVDAPPPILLEMFMERAEEINLSEITLAKLAKAKGKSPQVKKLAERLLTDHQANSVELKQLANAQNIVLPTETSQKLRDQGAGLDKMEEEAFDANFLANQKNSHAKAIALYQEATKSSDAEVKAFATKHLAMLKEHHHLAGGHAAAVETSATGVTGAETTGKTGIPPNGAEVPVKTHAPSDAGSSVKTGIPPNGAGAGTPTTPGNTGGGTGTGSDGK